MFVLVLLLPVVGRTRSDRFSGCLPKDVNLKSKIQEESSEPGSAKSKQKMTVEKKLIELGASCKGKLVDKSSKEIRFVHLIGCWGNPPEDYQDQLDKQQAELSKLKEKFTVIAISCEQASTSKEIN
jgi:hypothetical protein